MQRQPASGIDQPLKLKKSGPVQVKKAVFREFLGDIPDFNETRFPHIESGNDTDSRLILNM